MKNYIKKLNDQLEKGLLNYIDKVTRTLYPKQKIKEDDKDNDEPTLLI